MTQLSHHLFAMIVVPRLTMNPILADCIIFHPLYWYIYEIYIIIFIYIYIYIKYNIYIYIKYNIYILSIEVIWNLTIFWDLSAKNRRCWEDGAPGMKPKAQPRWHHCGNQPLDTSIWPQMMENVANARKKVRSVIVFNKIILQFDRRGFL